MDKMLFIAMNGAKHVALQQATTSNNLANANTNGFKAELVAFRALPVVGDGVPTRAFSVDSTVGHDPNQGPINHTGNDQDFAIKGHGFFAVQDPQGNEAYTRDGGYVVDENGLMRTRSGRLILGDGGPLTIPPNSRVELGTDGTVTAVAIDQGVRQAQVVGRIKMVADESGKDFYKGNDGLFRRRDGGIPELDETRSLISGAVEGSNVNSVETLVQMVNHARQYDLNIKLMQTADQNARQANSIMSLSN